MASQVINNFASRTRWEDPGGRIGMQGMLGNLLACGSTGVLSALGIGNSFTGSTGPAGPTGAVGAAGPAGAQGVIGPTGPPGISFPVNALQSTFTFTVVGDYTSGPGPSQTCTPTLTITPSTASSLIMVSINFGDIQADNNLVVALTLTRNGVAVASNPNGLLGITATGSETRAIPASFSWLDAPGTTSPVTYQGLLIYVSGNGTAHVNSAGHTGWINVSEIH